MSEAPANTPAFKRLRAITLPVLKMEGRKPKYILFLEAMHEGKTVDKDKGPATIARALDMVTGEEGLFICSTVTQRELIEQFPGNAYVGRGFEITHTRVPDKRYNLVSIVEVSVPEAVAMAAKALQEAARASASKKAA